jgi:hypothetical protein
MTDLPDEVTRRGWFVFLAIAGSALLICDRYVCSYAVSVSECSEQHHMPDMLCACEPRWNSST